MNQRITPDYIRELKPNEIFVFGSNLSGYHGGGAARLAMDKWGGPMGKRSRTARTNVCHPHHAGWTRDDTALRRPICPVCQSES